MVIAQVPSLRFSSGHLPALLPHQWLPCTPRTTFGWPPKHPGLIAWTCFPLLPHPSPYWPPYWDLKCLLFPASCLSPAPLTRTNLCRPPSLSYFPCLPLNRCLRTACSYPTQHLSFEDLDTCFVASPYEAGSSTQLGSRSPWTSPGIQHTGSK